MSLSAKALKQTSAERVAPLKGRPSPDHLLIHEIYRSLQGEGTHVGRPCTFVRTAACHLRCRYCDTEHAFAGGEWLTVGALIEKVREVGDDLVLITGGEPLLQPAIKPVVHALCSLGSKVLIETSGAVSTEGLHADAIRIIDVKTPGSGEADRNYWRNLDLLRPIDEVKFVVCDREDYAFSRRVIVEHKLDKRAEVLISPAFGQIEPAELAAWILQDGLNVRLQVQLHKVIWGDRTGV